MNLDSRKSGKQVDDVSDEDLLDLVMAGNPEQIALSQSGDDAGEDEDDDGEDGLGDDAWDVDDQDDDLELDDEEADEDDDLDEDEGDETAEGGDDEDEGEQPAPEAQQTDPPAPADPMLQQLAAQNQSLMAVVQQQQAQLQAFLQRQTPPQQPAGPDPQVRALVETLLDKTVSTEQVNAAIKAAPIHVQNEAARVYREYLARDVDRAFGVVEQPQLPDMQEVVQQAVQQALQPVHQREFVGHLYREAGLGENDRDLLAWGLQRIQQGSRVEDVVELMRTKKQREQLGKQASKVKQQQRDAQANKKRRRSTGGRRRRRDGKRQANVSLDMDMEAIAEEVMATGDDEIPEGLFLERGA